MPSADAPPAPPRRTWKQRLRAVPTELVILTALAALTRFVALSSPHAIVFDEVYFREFALHYKEHTYYFDVHPPLGKLLLGLWGAIAGVHATALDKTDPAVALRMLPALAGTLLIPVFYVMLRELSRSRRIATFGAAMLLLDNALLVESRLILVDSMLVLFGISAVTLALVARRYTGRKYWVLLGLAAALGGATAATKVSGLTALGLVGLIWIVDVIRERRHWKPAVGQLVLLGLAPLLVYMAAFAVHFALLTKTGANYDAYMGQPFQATLKGNPNYSADAHRSFLQKFADLNGVMQRSQLSLDGQTHPYASKWTSWPIMKRDVYLYVEGVANNKARYLYTLGNPFVWWGTLLGAAIVLGGWALRRQRFAPYKWSLIFLAIGWVANYLPFALIHRPMFLYHYLFGLVFSVAFVTVGLGALTGWSTEDHRPFTFETRRSTLVYWGLLAGALLAFLYFAPLTYGIPLTPDGLQDRMWLKSWR
ncbi:MAG: phospholipid carrier-dependent glycosyltransferase [Patulibacter sp.]